MEDIKNGDIVRYKGTLYQVRAVLMKTLYLSKMIKCTSTVIETELDERNNDYKVVITGGKMNGS